MQLWMRERDQLIEQTRAFVEGVAAARPGANVKASVHAEPVHAEPVKAEPLRVEPGRAERARAAGPGSPIVLPALAPAASERAEIERRVAKFKAQQEKFQRAREADYQEIFSKTRIREGNAARA